MSAPEAKEPFTGAPAIILHRSGDYKPGERVNGSIFIGRFDIADGYARKFGIITDWFDAALDLGKPGTFVDAARTVANTNENGRGGLILDMARYKVELFEKLKTGEGSGKNVLAPREVMEAMYLLRNVGEYQRLAECGLPGKLITTATVTDEAHRQWTCSPYSNLPKHFQVVNFANGHTDWGNRDYTHVSARVCYAEPAP